MNRETYIRLFGEFIEVYKSLPVLWQVKHKDHANEIKQNEAYAILLQKFQQIIPNADLALLKCKISQMRDLSERLKFLSDQEVPMRFSSIDITDGNFPEGILTTSKKRKSNPEVERNEILKNLSDNFIASCSRKPDEFSVVAAVWGGELRKLNPEQQIFAKKFIWEVLFQGSLNMLNEFTFLSASSITPSVESPEERRNDAVKLEPQ